MHYGFSSQRAPERGAVARLLFGFARALEDGARRIVQQDAGGRQAARPLGAAPAEPLGDLPPVRAARVDEQTNAVSGRRSLRHVWRLVVVVARAVVQHADREIETHALPNADAQLIPVVAGFVAQHADGLVHADALGVA